MAWGMGDGAHLSPAQQQLRESGRRGLRSPDRKPQGQAAGMGQPGHNGAGGLGWGGQATRPGARLTPQSQEAR